MNAADVLVGVGQTVNGVGGSLILNALTLGAYGQVTAAISLWEGYEKDGWSGVAMAFNENLNPLYRIPVGIARASEAADRGDFQAVGREVSSAALDTATLVGAAAGLARLPSGLPKVRGTQIGLRAPALVDELKIAMERGTYDFSAPRGQIAGVVDPKGVYHVTEGHHRMVAAQELARKDPTHVRQLLENGNFRQGSPPPTSRPLPSREWWGAFRNWMGF